MNNYLKLKELHSFEPPHFISMALPLTVMMSPRTDLKQSQSPT